MIQENDIPLPIRFNAFKHHRNHILQLLNGTSAETLINLMDPLCNNYIDVYTGSLTPTEIGKQIIDRLEQLKVIGNDAFKEWLNRSSGHRLIELDDQSFWIIREGIETNRYIHIHPARTGKYTIRFKGSTLKTVYLLYFDAQEINSPPTVSEINSIRAKIGLSPVKRLEQGKGIMKCYRQFFDNQ